MKQFARIFLLAILLLISPSVFAETKVFNPGAAPDCKLNKAVKGKWVSTTDAYDGQPVELSPVGSAGKFSSFKMNGQHYASRTECFTSADAAGGGSESPPVDGELKRWFVEPRGRYAILMGDGVKGGTTTSGTVTQTVGAYDLGFGYGGRVGFRIDEQRALFVEGITMTGTQTATYSGAATGSATAAEKFLRINAGYITHFGAGPFRPYSALGLGIVSFSGSLAGTISSIGPFEVQYSATAFNLVAELGATYAFSPMFELVASVDYQYLSIKQYKVEKSNFPTITTGSNLSNTVGYSHLGLALGARINF